MNKFDIGIIGAGIAGAFAALRLSEQHPNLKAIIFDLGRPPGKRRRQLEGWFGCFPVGDGKIYTNDLDAVSNIVDGRKAKPANNWVMSKFDEINSLKVIKDSLPQVALQKKIKELNFNIKNNNYIQWKPEYVHSLSKNVASIIEKSGNVQFSFDNEVYQITKKKNSFVVSSAEGEFICNKLILCVGRSGWRWVSNLYKDLGIIADNDYANFGIKVEISSQYMKEFNKSHCTLSKDKLEIGPFSWSGTVIPEDHADVVIAAFRSNEERWKSEKVSFSITSSRYFKDEGVYQTDRLSKLAFLLSNDRVSKEKIKTLIKNNNQLSLLKEYDWLLDVLKEVEVLIPQLSNRGYFHIPDISPLPAKIKLSSNLESEVEGLFVAGENAGIKGILAAAIMGSVCADSACKD